jgi:DNA polymerase-1
MSKLVLVDGSSYLYRAFHALPDLRTSRGEPTGAIRGVVAMLRRLVEDGNPEYFAVVFDAPGKTFRDDWYPQYKANRSPMPDDLAAQIAPLHELIRAHGWPLLMIEGVEADDVIGTLVRRGEATGIDSVISTGDKDLAQLVTSRVTLVNTMSNEMLDEAGVAAKFGVRADQLLDLLTLTGDAIDNVPGVAKVGPKTAAKWLAQYGTLEKVMAHANEIGGAVGENLRAALSWLPQGRRLLTVKTDCTLPFEPIELVIRPADAAALKNLYQRFEFKSWLKDVDGAPAKTTDTGVRPEAVAVPEEQPPRAAVVRQYETILDQDALDRWLAAIERADLVTFDTETTSLDPMQARIVGISFAIEPGRAAYVPVEHRYAGAPAQLPLDAVLTRLKPWLENPRAKKLGHNVKYDQHVLANHGIALAGVAHDTMLQSYVLESHRLHDMDSLARRHLDVKTLTYAEVAGKGAGQIPFDQVAVERATEYSAEDVDITLQLHGALYPRIAADAELTHVYERIELPTREVLFRMERNGVLLDPALLAAQSRVLGERMLALEQQAFQLAGGPFNLGSPRQLGEILFDRMKLPVMRKTATGQPSTDEEVLQELAADYPLPKLLLEHRMLSKLKST